jgi:PAS domain S-box-containing protein
MSSSVLTSKDLQSVYQAFIAADLGWWDYDPVTKVAYWSKRSKELFGLFSDKEITYTDWAAAVHPDDLKRAGDQLQASFETTGYYDVEYRTIGIEDGKLRWVRSVAKVLYDQQGNPNRMLGVLIETTKEKDATAIAEENNQHLKLIANTMPQLVWVTLPDGYHDFYNQRWYDYTGLDYERTKGEGWNSVLHPDDQARAWKVWRHSLETGSAYEIEYRLKRFDGEYRWFLGRALPLRDEKGNIRQWFGTCTDIHDQKRLNEQLAESKSELDQLANAMPQLVWMAQPDGTVTYFNDRISLYSGAQWKADGIWSWENLVHPDDIERTVITGSNPSARETRTRWLIG